MDYMIEFENVLKEFLPHEMIVSVESYGEGHINGTFLVKTNDRNYILQKINTKVFPDVDRLMENIVNVTDFLIKKGVVTLEVIKTSDGSAFAERNSLSKVTDGIREGRIPLRVTHNDTKLNNILIDLDTGKSKSIIDLDTVMPGSLLYDFGDSIRFGASTTEEDEPDTEKVHFDINLYNAYKNGFIRAMGDAVTIAETELMPYSAYLMTIDCGMRFLTDYLSGDTYFKTKYPDHNLVRCRTQLKLVSEMEKIFDLYTIG